MHDQTAALDVPQEFVTESHALTCALDKSGDIRHDEALFLVDSHNSQHWGEGSEVVSGDLGLCSRYHRNER